MTHGDFVDDVDPEHCEAVLSVMTEIASEVCQGPARVARMKARREEKRNYGVKRVYPPAKRCVAAAKGRRLD
jgi:hypothetical protein